MRDGRLRNLLSLFLVPKLQQCIDSEKLRSPIRARIRAIKERNLIFFFWANGLNRLNVTESPLIRFLAIKTPTVSENQQKEAAQPEAFLTTGGPAIHAGSSVGNVETISLTSKRVKPLFFFISLRGSKGKSEPLYRHCCIPTEQNRQARARAFLFGVQADYARMQRDHSGLVSTKS
ncbi:hypothetical protein AA313_de0203305 [Arthrobotrys entomopaga]|nr:hypothetical protein AA313_de0203305 [Arthrobotrys entomopaga]